MRRWQRVLRALRHGAGSNRGASLVELIMAIIVAVVALYPLLSTMISAASNAPTGELVTRATFLAQGELERLLSDYRSPSRGYDYILAANYPDVSAIPSQPGFTVTFSVAGEDSIDTVKFREVVVAATHPAIPSVQLVTWVVAP